MTPSVDPMPYRGMNFLPDGLEGLARPVVLLLSSETVEFSWDVSLGWRTTGSLATLRFLRLAWELDFAGRP